MAKELSFVKNLRKRFDIFCFRNRDKGIPNLMLYISIANAVVYLISLTTGNALYNALCFDRDLILQGQVWRLLTCVCTSVFGYSNFLLVGISLLCYYSLGRAIENAWGTLRFNLFYLMGLLMMDVFAMVFGGMSFTWNGIEYLMPSSYYADMGSYLNLSLFIAYATLNPDAHFLLFFIIPVKAWIFALFDLVITLYDVYYYTFVIPAFPHGLFPLVALANYFLFFGKNVLNVIPITWRMNARRLFRKKPKRQKGGPKVVNFQTAGSYQAATAKPTAPYTHRCTVCGRTDTDHPELEFRYCSRCNGYFCYCEDHISSHTHVE